MQYLILSYQFIIILIYQFKISFVQERLEQFNTLKQKHQQEQNSVKHQVKLPDGKQLEVENKTFFEVAKEIVKASKVYSKFVVAELNGELYDLSDKVCADGDLKFLTFEDPKGKEVFWHSSAHILGAALEKLYGAKLTHGPVTENGFFYDSQMQDKVMEIADLSKVKQAMSEYIKEANTAKDTETEKIMVTKQEALDLFKYNPLKCELISEHVKDGDMCAIYRMHQFVDFCRGPHVRDISVIKAIDISNCSAAYFKGDAQRESLQRVYGISFPSETELKAYQTMIEEAKKRDHRVIAQQMNLFYLHQLAPGMPLFNQNGCHVYRKLEDFIRNILHRHHYIEVITPQMFNTELWKISGHLDHYKDNMYMIDKACTGGVEYGLKPMNCPGHCLIYKQQFHNSQQLPIRMSEFGIVHRNELSGALTGLTRVCKFEQDDAHIFCTVDQIENEIRDIFEIIKEVYDVFGLECSFGLSLRPEDKIGDDALWDKAENALRTVLKHSGKPFVENPGDGAFYGPKIDIQIQDALGRKHQCGTIQLDFNLPNRFELRYQDDQVFKQPVMIHRAIFGSLERFLGILIENTAGKFPFFVSPRQCLIVPVGEAQNEACKQIAEKLYQEGFEVVADCSSEKMQKKIVKGFNDKFCFIGVVGAKEVQNNEINLQGRYFGNEKKNMKVEDVIALFKDMETKHQ